MRLTDERIAEILRPKDLMGETELESLAREVRELREAHSVACETCDGLRDSNQKLRAENVRLERELRKSVEDAEQYRKNWLSLQNEIGVHCLISAVELVKSIKATIERLTRERDAHEAEAKRQHENFHREHLRANNLECTAHNLELGIETLTRELAEARELLRDLESRFPLIVQHVRNNPCTATEQPEPSGELVPWTAETRPRGPVIFRNGGIEYMLVSWKPAGVTLEAGFRNWLELATLYWEWSRDGVTWKRCGVVR